MNRLLILGAALALIACGKSGDGAGEAKGGAYGQKAGGNAASKGPAPAPVQQATLVKKGGAPTSQPTSQPTGKMPAGHPPMGKGMPAGHPPMGAQGKPGMPAGHPPMGGQGKPGMPAGHPPMGGQGKPGMPAGHPPAAAGAGGALAGTIQIASGLESRIKAGSVLYVIVRRDAGEGQRGMLLAATKHPVNAKSFPFKYLVTSANVMMQGTQLAGPVRIEARIDQDGDAMSKQPGDIVGALGSVVTVGAKGADFELNKTL